MKRNLLSTKAFALFDKGYSKREIAEALKINLTTVYDWLKNRDELESYNRHTKPLNKTEERNLIKELEEKEHVIKNMFDIKKTIEQYQEEIPKWTKINPSKGKNSSVGIPTLFASDWHFGETVDPKQINGMNCYDTKIARARSTMFFSRGIDLLRNNMMKTDYPGIVLALGGDMSSGDIHDELKQTNDSTSPQSVLDLFQVLRAGILELKKEFGKVFVPCVSGNHGRLTHKIQMKDRNFTNFDWMLYKFLEQSFQGDKDVSFYIPDSSDAYYKIYDHTFCLTHGDQFRGGDSIIGAIGPIKRGHQKKLSRNSAVGLTFDTMILGHWHQYMPGQKLIVNGSLIGYNEYAYQCNFGYEIAQQALWVNHYKHGITHHMPIIVQDEVEEAKLIRAASHVAKVEPKRFNKSDWVSVYE